MSSNTSERTCRKRLNMFLWSSAALCRLLHYFYAFMKTQTRFHVLGFWRLIKTSQIFESRNDSRKYRATKMYRTVYETTLFDSVCMRITTSTHSYFVSSLASLVAKQRRVSRLWAEQEQHRNEQWFFWNARAAFFCPRQTIIIQMKNNWIKQKKVMSI